MISVSSNFKKAMKQPVKEIRAYINTPTLEIKSEDDLISFKISCDTSMCKTAMRKLEAKYTGEHNLLGQWVNVGFGVRLEDNTFEFLDYGNFLITEITTTKDTGVTQIVAYDKMINTMTEYVPLDVEYPINLYDYTKLLCKTCGLELLNTSLINGSWQVTKELWENISGITYRDILVQIAQATASTCIITNDDKVYFKYIFSTGEQLTYDNMKKLKLEPMYGEINSLVLSRTPQEDNIYMKDEESIKTNGITEFKIENNEIIDKDRDNAIIPIYNMLRGISYYPFETTTEGLGWYEIGDQLDIVNDTGDVFNTVLFNFSITIDGSIKEILKTIADTKTQTQYQYATSIGKRVKNTEIICDKQEQYIQQLVSDMYEENGIVHENFTKTYQDIQNIVNSVQNSGGNNLIKNSVMFDYDSNNKPNEWYVSECGINLFNYVDNLISSVSGLTNTLNKDGSITTTGIPTQNYVNVVAQQDITNLLEDGATYTISQEVPTHELKIVVGAITESGSIKYYVGDSGSMSFVVNKKNYKKYIVWVQCNTTTSWGTASRTITNKYMLYKGNGNKSFAPYTTGAIIINSSAEALSSGSLSGHVFTLKDKTVKQRVTVKIDDETTPDDEKTYYTFSTKIKKGAVGSCYVKMYNSNEEYIIEVPAGESVYYKDFEIKGLLPKDTYYDIEFYGSADSDATFTDNMLAVGTYKSQWTQANGEIMNTQVNINLNGVLVKSSVYLGDYTVMSPLEFAGYSNINGTITKVFSLNKDITLVKKLEAEDEVKMVPIKVVPITSGDLQGWAFVPST